MVVQMPPFRRQHLRFLQRVKQLAVQKLLAQLAVEALVIAVLPRAAGLDVQRLHAQLWQPLSDGQPPFRSPGLIGNLSASVAV